MKTLAACETQPLTAEGLRSLVEATGEFHYLRTTRTLREAAAMAVKAEPDLLLVDKTFGLPALLNWTAELSRRGCRSSIVVWGTSISEAEALRLLQQGVRGILHKMAEPGTVLACLAAVAAGRSWMEDSIFREPLWMGQRPRSELTPREQQVLELVEQGMKNREIAAALDISSGTVKIHLRHIFEKTGVRGRYGLVLSGMRDKGAFGLSDDGEASAAAQPLLIQQCP